MSSIGIFFEQNWARHALIPLGGLNLLYWRQIPFVNFLDLDLLRHALPSGVVVLILGMDILVILLLNLPEVAKRFRDPYASQEEDEATDTWNPF